MTLGISPGLLILHGNRLESLRDTVVQWLARHPLEPLEEEVFLVQSNGAAEWLKMALARANGICASTRVELPARFLWRMYRQVLGRDAVPAQSALDRTPLAWRLMRLLPARLDDAAYAPIARFLEGDDLGRRWQLASRLADLFDQYQVYRADWLDAWAAGRDVLIDATNRAQPLSVDDRWQPALWRELLGELTDDERRATRPRIHAEFLAEVNDRPARELPLPRRVTLFGASHLPGQTLHALAALARHVQVLMAVPNPCRYHWADIIEGRELFHLPQHRQSSRGERDLAAVPLEAMHVHAHPLLAAWGRQGRDFMRLLDRFDDSQRARHAFDIPRIDLFDDAPGDTLLEQVQAHVRDLLPLPEHVTTPVPASDRSIVFHIAHSPQREVEVLHDQLLHWLAHPPGDAPLRPRDIVVMVPDIEVFAPAIRAVFGQYPRDDPRFIPFDIADLRGRGAEPLLIGIEWLMRLPAQRIGLTEVRALLDVPAIAARFDIDATELHRVQAWMTGAGVRWGLHQAQRGDLGLDACGEQNTWLFGLRRMLLGYAAGGEHAFAGIEPYDEIGGLDAALVGSLVDLVDALVDWWETSRIEAAPDAWGARCRNLLERFVRPTDEREKLTSATLSAALGDWLDACTAAGFHSALPLPVVREAWLGGVDESGRGGRFLAGGVTFCTLMPLRAVPFEIVCLLGMNDGAYPRATRRSDFDLMAAPGQPRPGDRSRRDDDRYLMLEALLSARRVLSISWSGRSVRDNSGQPPSVLVSQLRDYLAAAWQGEAGSLLDERTTQHPLQPFSRRYFEGGGWFTYAAEWRPAHQPGNVNQASGLLPVFDAQGTALSVQQLIRFLKNPVREFFRAQLNVRFRDDDEPGDDDESFGLDSLEEHGLLGQLIADAAAVSGDARLHLPERLDRLQRAGALPIGELGRRTARELELKAWPMLSAWAAMNARYATEAPKHPLRVAHDGLLLDDWLDGLRTDGATSAWLSMSPSILVDGVKPPRPKPDKLVDAWVRMLVAGASGLALTSVLVGQDATLTARPLDAEAARVALIDLIDTWRSGMAQPLPMPLRTGLAFVAETREPGEVYEGGAFTRGEVLEPSLARVFPDFDALTAPGLFEDLALQVLGPLYRWARSHVGTQRHAVLSPDDADADAHSDIDIDD